MFGASRQGNWPGESARGADEVRREPTLLSQNTACSAIKGVEARERISVATALYEVQWVKLSLAT